MNQEIKKLWIAALRSGEYKQGRYQLRNTNNEFCCLGVLCNLHAQAHPKIAKKEKDLRSYLGEKRILPYQVRQWAGIDSKSGRYNVGSGSASLTTANDGRGKNFNQIADIIERHF